MTEQPEDAVQYDMFVAIAAATGTVWSLWQSGWAAFEGETGEQGLPLWASAAEAESWREANALDWEAMPLDMDWLLDDILPNIAKENGLVILFQESDEGLWVQPTLLGEDLSEALSDEE